MERYMLYCYDPNTKSFGIYKMNSLFNFMRILPWTKDKQLTTSYMLLPRNIDRLWD